MKKVKMSTLGRLLQPRQSAQEFKKFNVKASGWHRIAQVDNQYHGSIGMINCASFYNETSPFIVSLIVSTRYRNYGFIKSIEKSAINYLTKARIVYPVGHNNPSFVDLYYSISASNDVTIALSGQINMSLLDNIVLGEIPSSYASYEVTL